MAETAPEQFASGITFGEGCRNAYMIRAVMQLSHFLGLPLQSLFHFNELG
jgi:hypothetical protein